MHLSNQDNPGVLYWLSGTGHAAVLAVSIWSLRQWWKGSIAILTDDVNGPAGAIGRDERLSVMSLRMDFDKLGRNSAMVAKTTLHRWSPFEPSIFLDADTLVTGPIDALFASEEEQVVWTQFADWRIRWNIGGNSSPYHGRVERFAKAAQCEDLARKRFAENVPAINNGVFGFRRGASVLEPAYELARKGYRVFIPDECAIALVAADHPHRLLDCRWNHSPRHQRHPPEAVHVWHCHGGKHLHRNVKGLWLAAFEQCWRSNIGDVRSWIPPTERDSYLSMLGVNHAGVP